MTRSRVLAKLVTSYLALTLLIVTPEVEGDARQMDVRRFPATLATNAVVLASTSCPATPINCAVRCSAAATCNGFNLYGSPGIAKRGLCELLEFDDLPRVTLVAAEEFQNFYARDPLVSLPTAVADTTSAAVTTSPGQFNSLYRRLDWTHSLSLVSLSLVLLSLVLLSLVSLSLVLLSLVSLSLVSLSLVSLSLVSLPLVSLPLVSLSLVLLSLVSLSLVLLSLVELSLVLLSLVLLSSTFNVRFRLSEIHCLRLPENV